MGSLLDVGDSAVGDASQVADQLGLISGILDSDVNVTDITAQIQARSAPPPPTPPLRHPSRPPAEGLHWKRSMCVVDRRAGEQAAAPEDVAASNAVAVRLGSFLVRT